ncbi:hypothetical protein [Thermomonospora umbrina]|uniref:hypothetical protein n=1 Tax=Thermomonospora umbrina TaxID=111806 RepID=UPI0011C1CA36|nr:hypothetical protein [Thermomonospora umbrina]
MSAAALTIQAYAPERWGSFTVYPSDVPTTVSTATFAGGEATTVADFTRITGTGKVTIVNKSAGATHVAVAVRGYFLDATGEGGSEYRPLATSYLYDTRFGHGAPARTTPVPGNGELTFEAAGREGIPASGATAVAVNIVAMDQTAHGFLTLTPSDVTAGAGVLNYVPGEANSTFYVVPLSATGQLKLTNHHPGTLNVSITVRGYFTGSTTDASGPRYKPMNTKVLADTLTGVGTDGDTSPIAAGASLTFEATGASGAPSNTVAAAALNIDARTPVSAGWLSVYASGSKDPNISSVVFDEGETNNGFDLVVPGVDGRITITNHSTGTVHLQVSTRGYFIHTRVEVFPATEADDNPPPISPVNSAALQEAEERAEGDPETMAPPYHDTATGRLVTPIGADRVPVDQSPIQVAENQPDDGVGDASVENTPGMEMPTEPVEDDLDPVPVESGPMRTITPRTIFVPNTTHELQRIQDEVLTLDTTQLPSADQLQSAHIQAAKNRVVIEAFSVNDAMVDALTARYGPSKIAVRVISDAEPADAMCSNGIMNRACSHHFWGGSKMATMENGSYCTMGFMWRNSYGRFGLTAGHCGQKGHWFGSWVSSGSVAARGVGVKTGWNPKVGTVYGRGDLLFVNLDYTSDGQRSSPFVFNGGSATRNILPVKGRASRRPRVGDYVCSGGATKGDLCGWKISDTSINVRYASGGLVKWAVEAKRKGVCAAGGDSGGPVFTKVKVNTHVTEWGAVAQGIISGGGGGKTCRLYFTSIHDVQTLAPGDVQRYPFR